MAYSPNGVADRAPEDVRKALKESWDELEGVISCLMNCAPVRADLKHSGRFAIDAATSDTRASIYIVIDPEKKKRFSQLDDAIWRENAGLPPTCAS